MQEDYVTTKTKLLAYLGSLKAGQWVHAHSLCEDMDLRFTTVKNTLTTLENMGIVEKLIKTRHGTTAMFRIDPAYKVIMKDGTTAPFIPPEWEDAYGRRPNAV